MNDKNQIRLMLALAALVVIGIPWYLHAYHSPSAFAREAVLANLNDPDSAVFEGHRQGRGVDPFIYCGKVNARNRMGGMSGYTWYLATTQNGDSPYGSSSYQVQFDSSAGAVYAQIRTRCFGLDPE